MALDGTVAYRPLPPLGSGMAPDAVLPPRAALRGLVGFIFGLAASFGLGGAGALLSFPDAAVLALGSVGLWAGLLWACWSASRRCGTGRLRTDYGLMGGWGDAGWGALTGIAARIASGLAVIPFVLGGEEFQRGNTDAFTDFQGDAAALAVLAVAAVVGAPLVEELFFRGLLQRSLQPVLGIAGAIAAQALLFGVAHANPLLGLANLTVIAATGAAGLVFGVVAWWRRLPTTMVGHAVFNSVVVLLVLSGVGR